MLQHLTTSIISIRGPYRPFALVLAALQVPACEEALKPPAGHIASLLDASDVPSSARRLHASNPLTAHLVRSFHLALEFLLSQDYRDYCPEPTSCLPLPPL